MLEHRSLQFLVSGVAGGSVLSTLPPDEQHFLLPQEFDRPPSLLAGGELFELLAGDVAAENLHDALGAGELLEAHETRGVAEEEAARLPLGRFTGERGLAHTAHGVHDDAAPPSGRSMYSSRYQHRFS